MKDDVAAYSGTKLLNTPVEDLAQFFENKYKMCVPTLLREGIMVDQCEAEVDVSRDFLRVVYDNTRPLIVRGTRVEMTVPFDGDAGFFEVQPSRHTLSPPSASVQEDSLSICVEGAGLTGDFVKKELDRTVRDIEEYLAWLRDDVRPFNDSLLVVARDAINARRKKLLDDRHLLAELGYPLKIRSDAHVTYAAPEVRRRIQPALPPASTSPYAPEPVLANDDYDLILQVIESMSHVLERSPSAFANIDEEALRTHFLVQLNGHFEGNATGETFNASGKTDILVRVQDRNVFIGECKFWDGPESLRRAIDQILDYSAWRDTKVAIVLFSRRRDFSSVLCAIESTVESHGNYKRTHKRRSETSFQYIFSHNNDRSREMLLTVLAFDVPVPA